MRKPSVFVDADILYSATLRGWLFNLAIDGAFDLFVTEDVIAEAVASWRDNNPKAQGAVTHRMAANIRQQSNVIDTYNCDVEFPGNDEGDIHVHAACADSGIEYLVTNDRGFLDLPEAVQDELPYEIYSINDFLTLVHNQSPSRIARLAGKEINRQIERGDEPQVVERLRSAGAPDFAELVDRHVRSLAGVGALVHAVSDESGPDASTGGSRV